MTFVSRATLARSLRQWVAASEAMTSLDNAMRVLYPTRHRPSVQAMAELVLLSMVRGYERHTQGVLGRLNQALARVLDDLDDLRNGRSLQGRTAGLRAADLTAIAVALDDLDTLENQLRFMLEGDESGGWASQLRLELEAGLTTRAGSGAGARSGPGARRGPGATTGPAPRGARPPAPRSFQDGAATLASAIRQAGPTPHAIWNGRRLPAAIRNAAHGLVVAAGGDVAAAVRRVLATGGADADAMVIAILWTERRIAPGTALREGLDHAAHQTAVTGLSFEWTASVERGAPDALGRTVGVDGLAEGFVVDAKHSNTPLEHLPHLTDEASPRPSFTEYVENVPTDVHIRHSGRGQSVAAAEREIVEAQHRILEQMRRQLDFARANGLRGIHWVFNSAEHADAFRQLSLQLPETYRSMQLRFTVGGLP